MPSKDRLGTGGIAVVPGTGEKVLPPEAAVVEAARVVVFRLGTVLVALAAARPPAIESRDGETSL
jgi:hypothetical protein